MTLEDISIFAELVGSAAIVISLVFVVYEIRLNRRQAELTNWREVL
ncbi:MAG: hypothetical protein HUJ27_05065 [Rhodobacteraceae bacterium]|nr:hypothetical protein [Paracoccaceae bacterium]